jgi:hypothetical protein
MVCYDYLSFELVSIRLEHKSFFGDEDFSFYFHFVFLFHLKRESIFAFNNVFLEAMCNLNTCYYRNYT